MNGGRRSPCHKTVLRDLIAYSQCIRSDKELIRNAKVIRQEKPQVLNIERRCRRQGRMTKLWNSHRPSRPSALFLADAAVVPQRFMKVSWRFFPFCLARVRSRPAYSSLARRYGHSGASRVTSTLQGALSRTLPGFACDGKAVNVLQRPDEFYLKLLVSCLMFSTFHIH